MEKCRRRIALLIRSARRSPKIKNRNHKITSHALPPRCRNTDLFAEKNDSMVRPKGGFLEIFSGMRLSSASTESVGDIVSSRKTRLWRTRNVFKLCSRAKNGEDVH